MGKSNSDIVQSLQHLNMAKQHFESFIRDFPGTNGARMFKRYVDKVDWIFNDLLTNPQFSREVTNGIMEEVNSDAYAVVALSEKMSLLPPDKREAMEDILDTLLSGAELTIENKNTNENETVQQNLA